MEETKPNVVDRFAQLVWASCKGYAGLWPARVCGSGKLFVGTYFNAQRIPWGHPYVPPSLMKKPRKEGEICVQYADRNLYVECCVIVSHLIADQQPHEQVPSVEQRGGATGPETYY